MSDDLDNLVKAMVHHESNGNPEAISKTGAIGLMQLMPATAHDEGVTNRFDPQQNLEAGKRYIGRLLHKYGDPVTALIAYNWGPGNVDKQGVKRAPKEALKYATDVMNTARSIGAFRSSQGQQQPVQMGAQAQPNQQAIPQRPQAPPPAPVQALNMPGLGDMPSLAPMPNLPPMPQR